MSYQIRHQTLIEMLLNTDSGAALMESCVEISEYK